MWASTRNLWVSVWNNRYDPTASDVNVVVGATLSLVCPRRMHIVHWIGLTVVIQHLLLLVIDAAIWNSRGKRSIGSLILLPLLFLTTEADKSCCRRRQAGEAGKIHRQPTFWVSKDDASEIESFSDLDFQPLLQFVLTFVFSHSVYNLWQNNDNNNNNIDKFYWKIVDKNIAVVFALGCKNQKN